MIVRVYAAAGTGNSIIDEFETGSIDRDDIHQEALEFAIEVTGFEWTVSVIEDGEEFSLEEYFTREKPTP